MNSSKQAMKIKTYTIRLSLIISFVFVSLGESRACGGWIDEDYYYYSLIFSQELINEPRYYPFLLNPYTAYYEADSAKIKNANIEEWQQYFNISYDDSYYLVFKAAEQDIQKLLSNEPVTDSKLSFADRAFVSKYKDALQYLVMAKDLEPYMRISGSDDGWYYYEKTYDDIELLPYTEISLELQQAWKKVKDKELKLRYGYQLVRFAHYNRRYEEAVELFNQYVAPLKYKPEMYYYALSQMAGAVRGTGDIIKANSLFFEVFSHSADLKTTAVTSMKLSEETNYESFQQQAKTTEQKNDADLLLGFINFSNPLASASKIIARSPDAIQAKVLVARAICMIEDDIKKYGDISDYNDKRFPIIEKRAQQNMAEAVAFVKSQADSDKVKQKNYWNIAAAYLCYLNRDYITAQNYLNKVDIREAGYRQQRDIIAMIIDIGREPRINSDTEDRIFTTYNDIFKSEYTSDGRGKAKYFVIDLLSNRYYLQKEYAKSFMLLNNLNSLHDNPNLTLLNDIEKLYNKTRKNTFEQYLTETFRIGVEDAENKNVSVPAYIKYMKGYVYLTNNQLEKAKQMFDQSGYTYEVLPIDVFGYNPIECYTCNENMKTDYLEEFPYLRPSMNERELVDILIKLENDAAGNSLKAAKANYLLGNFFYNTSVTGYYRNYLRFGYNGGYRQAFFYDDERNDLLTNKIYLKQIPPYYDNPVEIADKYLKKAYTLSSGDEFKARIVFALSKCEQEMHYQKIINENRNIYWWNYHTHTWVMISDRQYFKELMKYKNTRFFNEVKTNCSYFNYYVNHL